jgi:hypothetical protein
MAMIKKATLQHKSKTGTHDSNSPYNSNRTSYLSMNAYKNTLASNVLPAITSPKKGELEDYYGNNFRKINI